MKISEQWLREWVNPELETYQLADKLTSLGLEVEAVSPVAGAFKGVIVAYVISVDRHPKADRLSICSVDIGEAEPLSIVCGASNVRPCLKVALALIGAHLPDGLVIKESRLRGQLSQGMLCSMKELGLVAQSEGIIELPEDAPIGEDLRVYLNLNDYVFTLSITPNRADCLSVYGVARELAVATNQPLSEKITPEVKAEINDVYTADILAPQACPHYLGRLIQGIQSNAETPLWLKEKLRRAGMRAIHPVVDVTNYIMLEWGQPLHAFDVGRLSGPIQVRYSQPNESIRLLDGQIINFSEEVLVVADSQKPLAIAGIMGGELSGVTTETVDIFLESAFFDPILLSGAARRYRLCTDSSQRFERGVDPSGQRAAIERATLLIQSIMGGTAGPVTEYVSPAYFPKPKKVIFYPRHVIALTGVQLAEATMKRYLTGLGIQILSRETSTWELLIPLHRFDIMQSMDIVEELVRLEGYDKIPTLATPLPLKTGDVNKTDALLQRLVYAISQRGFIETIHYSFVDPTLQSSFYPEQDMLTLLNPISSELSQMRVSLWPGLIASLIYNTNRQQTSLRLFETGVVFEPISGEIQERCCIAGLLSGDTGHLSWNEASRKFDFFDMKGHVQSLLLYFGYSDITYQSKAHSVLHSGQSARILVESIPVGWIGALHPHWQDELGLANEVFLFELCVTSLLGKLNKKDVPQYHSLSKFPLIRRDLSLLVAEEVSAAEIKKAIEDCIHKAWLKSMDIFDVYKGDLGVKGKKSIAISLCLQAPDRTLVEAEIQDTMNNLMNILKLKLDITLRE